MIKKTNTKGMVFNIQKFSIHDGLGIRTLIFLKGCPLKCKWCSNPESQSFKREVMFLKDKCIKCGNCLEHCPNKCIDTYDFSINRNQCTGCGDCAEFCYSNAKKAIGELMTVDQVIKEIEKDRVFYHNSNGGVTVGGGEPTSQIEFLTELIGECKASNLHTAIETCGFVSWEKCEKVFSDLNQIFYDLKHMNGTMHKAYTGVDNAVILNNARKLAKMNKEIVFRVPLIPGYNCDEENIRRTGEFVSELTKENKNIKVEILPYHSLGQNKYEGLDKMYELKTVLTPEEYIRKKCNEILKDMGCLTVD